MSALRIVFMGTPDFAVPTLEALLAGPDTVAAVLCQPDRPRGRGKKLEPPPVKRVALAAGLPLLQPESVRGADFLETLAAFRPDLLVVVAYGKILPEAVLAVAPLGALNVHGSLLPKYRGAAPIQWAVINGDAETGVTIMRLDAGMDTGPTLLAVREPIRDDDTAGALYERLARLGAAALMEAVAGLKAGSLTPTPQNHDEASHAPMLTKELGHLDWTRPVRRLHCLIRGCDPWPSAYGFLNGQRFRFYAPECVDRPPEAAPGAIVRADKTGLYVAAGDGVLRLGEIQPEGKKRMPVAACLNGTPLAAGMVFN